MTNGEVLALTNVTKAFRETVAVDSLSLTVRAGTICGLLGPNGSGKTTTIRMVLNILLPDAGEIRLWSRPPQEVVRERVGYLPEERGLYPKMRVFEHLVFLAELHGVDGRTARERAERWPRELFQFEEYETGGWAKRKVEELSKGQQQTVQLIGALLHDPELVVLDEPFAGLDPVNAGHLRRIIRRLRDEGKTILLSTHRMEQVEQLCDDICLIARGHALVAGNLRQVKAGYGRNVVTMTMDGPDGFLQPDDVIAAVERRADGTRIRLQPGADAQTLLRRALEVGRVLRFEVVEPSLDEIFVEAVTAR